MQRILTYLEIPVLAMVPAALLIAAFFPIDQTAVLTMLVALAAVAVFFARFETSRPALRQIMPTVVLGALAAAGRILFAPLPNFKPVAAICIVAGAVFGKRSGFMVGALAALVSNFFFGHGPWTPWQMYAWGMVGYFAGVLAERGVFEHRLGVCVYGFAASLCFGILLTSWHIIGFVHPITWESSLLAFGASLPFDLSQGVATVAFLLVIFMPWKKKLERVKRKYAL